MKKIKNILLILVCILFLISCINLYYQHNRIKNLIIENNTAAFTCYSDNTILQERNEELQDEVDVLEVEKIKLEEEIKMLKKNTN